MDTESPCSVANSFDLLCAVSREANCLRPDIALVMQYRKQYDELIALHGVDRLDEFFFVMCRDVLLTDCYSFRSFNSGENITPKQVWNLFVSYVPLLEHLYTFTSISLDKNGLPLN